jgi:catechol 2,3-dioxygenase-like lactoylglutathione lyase family enzyme
MTKLVRRLDHVSLRTADIARSIDFYVGVLGLPIRASGVIRDGGSETLTAQHSIPFADLDLGDGQTVELLQLETSESNEPIDRPFPGRAHVSFVTPDVHAAYRAVADAGAPTSAPPTVLTEPGFWYGCTAFYARDPDGHTIEFIERPASDPRAVEDSSLDDTR